MAGGPASTRAGWLLRARAVPAIIAPLSRTGVTDDGQAHAGAP